MAAECTFVYGIDRPIKDMKATTRDVPWERNWFGDALYFKKQYEKIVSLQMRLLDRLESRAYTKVWPFRLTCTRALQVSYADGFTKCSQHRGIRWCYSIKGTPTVFLHAVSGRYPLRAPAQQSPGVVGSNYAKLLVA